MDWRAGYAPWPLGHRARDGAFHDDVTITYQAQKYGDGPHKLNEVHVACDGPDPRLANRSELTLEDAKHILKQRKQEH